MNLSSHMKGAINMVKEDVCIIRITNKSKTAVNLCNLFSYTCKIDTGDKLMSNNIDRIELVNSILLGLYIYLTPINSNKPIILDDYFLDTLISIIKENYNEPDQVVYFALDIVPKELVARYGYTSIELNFIKYDFKPVSIGDTILENQYILLEPFSLNN